MKQFSSYFIFVHCFLIGQLAFCQAPAITYANPGIYQVGKVINPLIPVNTGGAVTGAYINFTLFATPSPALYSVSNDGAGNLYLVNSGGQNVYRVTSAGLPSKLTLSTDTMSIDLKGIINDGAGNLFISDYRKGYINKYTKAGLLLSVINIDTVGSVYTPYGLAVDNKNNLFIADGQNGGVGQGKIFEISSGTVKPILYASGLTSPWGLAFDQAGNLFVSQNLANTVTKISSKGVKTQILGFNGPRSLAADPLGNIFVADFGSNSIKEISNTGVISTIKSGLPGPCGLTVDAAQNIYVANFGDGTVLKSALTYFTINASLPPGLTFNSRTGQISGTPTAAFPATIYTITASNPSGTATANVSIACSVPINWVGNSTINNNWTTAANWSPAVVPTSKDIVCIGANAGFNYRALPIVSGNLSAGAIYMGSQNASATYIPAGLIVNGTLTITNDITLQSDAASLSRNNYTTTLSGNGAINAANISIIANTTGGNTYLEKMTSSVKKLNVTGNVNLTTSSLSATKVYGSSFKVTGGVLNLSGIVNTVNGNSSTAVFGALGATIQFVNNNPLSGLSLSGVNSIGFNGVGSTIEYSGAAQNIYTTKAIPGLPAGITSYQNIKFSGTGVKTLTSGNLNIGGDYTNNLANDAANYVMLSNSPVIFNGTVAQALAGGAGKGTIFNNVTFSGASTKTMTSGLFSVLSSGLLTMSGSSSSTVLNAGGFLTLISDVNGSATVPAFTGPSITGNITVQRYITGGAGYRGYRLVSSPVSVSNAGLNKVISVGYPITNVYLKGTTGTAGGFDDGGNPNLYLFRENLAPSNTSFTSGNFRAVNNITMPGSYSLDGESGAFNIPVGNGFMMFYRGSRKADTKANEYVTTYVPQADTLNATGTLNQGAVKVSDWFTPTSQYLSFTGISGDATVNGFNLVGNPYPSSIDWDKYGTSAGSAIAAPGVGPFLYILDSKSSNYNVYQAGSASKAGTIATTASNIIPSGQGFFVVAGSTTASLTFNEAAKTNSQATAAIGNLFMGAPPVASVGQYMRLILAKDSVHIDGIMINFSNAAKSKYVFGEDAPYKLGNGPVSLASTSDDNIGLAINTLPLPAGSQVIKLQVGAATDGTYTLAMKEVKSIPAIYDVWLKDAYRKDSLDIKHNPTYIFEVIKSDTNSFGKNRFSLIIRQNPLLGLHLLSFTGAKITVGTQIIWKTENEQNYTNFTVERSTDNGTTFQVIGGFASTGAGSYSFIDKAPATTVNDQYRLKLVDLNGNITYSNIVIIQYAPNSNNIARNGMTIYPNPAISTINISINQTIPNPSYEIQIVNNLGTVIKTATSKTTAWQDDVSRLVPGTYIIKVINNVNKTEVGKGTFVKL